MSSRDVQLLKLLIPALDASRETLAEALRTSGVHTESCDFNAVTTDASPKPCTCGLSEAQREEP